MIVRYIDVPVYRDPEGDCSNGGISSRFRQLFVACPDGPWSFDASEAVPLNLCMVRRRVICGQPYADIVPAAVDDAGNVIPRPYWYMFGGNLAHTSDSRLAEAARVFYPLKVCDRRE